MKLAEIFHSGDTSGIIAQSHIKNKLRYEQLLEISHKIVVDIV